MSEEVLSGTTDDQFKRLLELPIGEYNFANTTKWIFNIPIGHLFHVRNDNNDGQVLEYPLNCKSVSFPEFRIGTTKTAFMSYGFDLSTRQNVTDKGITFHFLISNNWLQYLMLLKWFELEDYTRYTLNRSDLQTVELGDGIKPTIDDSQFRTPYDTGKDPYYSTQGPMVPCNLYLLNNFNKRIATINFENAWLASIKPVDLDYSKTSETELSTSAELKFYKYNIIIHDEALKQFFPKTSE